MALYVETLKHYFAANDVTDNGKKAIFLSVIGPKVYKLLSSLMAPAVPGDKAFDELVGVLKNHYNPRPSEIVQRFKFHGQFRLSMVAQWPHFP